jgi:3-methyladenine DNA glycosylase/8-oxoguanine DNA glycosylase
VTPANPNGLRAAVAAVAKADPVMARLIEQHGPPKELARRAPGRAGRSRFEQLSEAIAYQQLAGKAAEAIWRRIRATVDGPFTAENVLANGLGPLRAAGASNAKALAQLDLAEKVATGAVRLDRAGRLSDDEIVSQLVTVRGIGPWTAEMFLIFTLGRLDVWPVGDYGVRAGYARAYGLPELPTPKELTPLGDRFRPYRTIAAWYCWRAVSTALPT